MVSVCFVCLGNICRSPTAEGVMKHLLCASGLEHAVHVDSAGTAGYHVGEPPDRRAQAAARRRGIVLDSRARQFGGDDWHRFDYILAMDQDNYEDLVARAPSKQLAKKVRLLRSFDPSAPKGASVPDPYYGGPKGFDDVLDMCEAAGRGLLAQIRREHGL
ncbi:MAG: low molecular weight phosphotyrosine protein phosphatase [Polyangiaceae bacterium]|nr:low molecular weight phosphotyrosine protein phosphatase [Polyangiaceae bacterium]